MSSPPTASGSLRHLARRRASERAVRPALLSSSSSSSRGHRRRSCCSYPSCVYRPFKMPTGRSARCSGRVAYALHVERSTTVPPPLPSGGTNRASTATVRPWRRRPPRSACSLGAPRRRRRPQRPQGRISRSGQPLPAPTRSSSPRRNRKLRACSTAAATSLLTRPPRTGYSARFPLVLRLPLGKFAEHSPPSPSQLSQVPGEGSEVSGRRGRVVCVFTDGPNSGRVLVTFAQPEAPGHVEHVLRPECLGVGAEQGALAPGSDGGGPRREADRPLHWAHSTVTAAPPSAPAGTRVHCTLVTRDAEGRRCPGAMAEDLRVVVFGEGCEATAVQPVAGDGAAFEFSFTTQRTGAAVVGCAWCNDWGPCALVQVTPAGVDLLQRSVIDVRPAVCAAGEVMRGRVVPRDTWGNAAATVSPEDFTMCVRNAGVELCTTPLERGADGALEFSFVPVAEGEVEVSAGCGGLVLQCAQPLACRAGDADWGRSIVQPSAFELGVGDMVPGDVVLRDSYGNCAAPKAGSGRPTLAAVLPERVPLPLSALAGDEGDEEGAGGGEHGFELECTRRGLLLLHCASSATGEGVVAKVSVGGGVLPVHWGRTTVSLAPRCVEAGAELTCTVLPRDRYGNVLDQGPAPEDFVVEIRTSAGARSAAGPLRRCPGGALLLTVTAKQAGEAWAELSRRPAEVEAGAAGRAAEEGPKRSNEVTVVAAALSWASSEVVLPPEARAGETVTATVRARDRLGNPCAALEPEDVTLLALNQDTRVPHSAPQRDPSGEPGVFSFTFVPTAAGAAVVRAAYGGASTESRPCRILPGRMDWERSSVVLDRRRQAAGRPLRCEVIFRDAWGNETCDGPESLRGFTVSACRPQGRPLVGEGELFIAEPEPLLAPPEERRTTVHEAETAPVAEERDPENQPEAESSPVVQSEQTLSQGGARGAAGAAGPGYSRFCVLIEPRIAGDLEAQVEFADVTLSSEPAAVVPAEISWEHSRIVLRGDSATAGQPLHGELRTQDRFGNVSDTMAFTEDEDMTPTPARLSDFALSAAVAGGGRRKGEREDPRVEPRAEGAAAGVLPFTLIPRLAGVLAVTASFHAAPGSPLRAECPVLGGEPLWGSTTVSLEPAEAHAGGELRAVVLLRDACGNEARPGCPLRVLVRNEQDEHLAQPPLPGADGDSVFTVVVIRAGTARAYVTPGGEAAATESAVESNDVQVRAGARCLARTTIEWVSPEGTVAGAVLEGVATFRDEFGNPTAGSAGDVRIEADNAGVPCGVDAAPQEPGACTVRFTCQPTKRGPVCATLVGIADGATVRGPPAAVAPAELHWPSCSLEWAAPPPPAEGVPEVRAGERAAAALTCRDRFGNLALPEGGAAAFSVEFATDGSPLPPPEPRLPGAGPPSEAGSVFTLEVCPTAAGRGELAVGYRADPAAQPLRCALDIQAGEIDWGCSVVEADLAEVQAGEAVLYTIRLRDAHGNPAACRDPTVFTPTVTNAGAECAGVSAVSGSGSTFSFTAEPATAGTVQAAVTYAGALGAAPLRSSTTTVVPGPIDFASCTLAILQTPAAAGEPCRAMLTLKDRFGNPAALPEGTTPADFSCSITNTGEQEVRELPSCEPLRQGQAPHELLLVFEPELKGRVEVEMLMKGSYHTQSAACPCVSGRPFSQTSKVDLHPQEVTAGDEVQATVTLCDVKGNAADFSLGTMVVVVENAGAAPPPSALAPVEGGFCFSFRPTKKGTARVTVRDKASPLDIASEEVAVRCGPLCAATTTAVLEPSPVVAGERCRLRILPCDQHRNPLCDGDAQGAAALIADLALQPRNGSAEIPAPTLTPAGGGALVCEFVPTERGHASVEASGREVAVRSNPVEVRSAAIHWPSCETAWVPTGRPRCGVPAGGKATAAITCRDRFGNPAFPGAADKKFLKGGFVVSAQTEGGAQLAPPAVYAPGKTPLAEASTFHFDLTLVAAGETEVQVRLAGDPGAPAHTVHAAVEGGPLCWPKCTLSLEEKEVDAGTKLVYTLLLVDAHGNPATGADAAMFTPVVDNSGCNLDVSAVRGEGSCFTFEATPTAAGKAAGAVGYVKEPKKQVKAPVCTVRPGPPHWPSCELAFADGTAAAGEECRLRLLLRDEHGNPSTLARGPLRLADISFDITNTGVEGAPPQELRPLRPPENPPKGPHEVWAAVEPALKGRLAARCAAPGRDPLTAECEVVGGRPNSRTSTVTLEPAGGVLAGETVTATVQVRDAKGNPTDFSLKAMVPSASSEGQGPAPRCSDPEPVPGGFRFTFAPTRSGTAQGAVRDKQSKLDIRSEPVPVRCGPFCPEKSTVAAEPPKQHAGVPCKVTVRARDRFGNDLGQEQGRLQELRSAAALSVRNGEAAVDPAPLEVSGGTLVSQFTPTKVGQAEAELRIDGATARSNTVQVGPGPMHWPECTVEFLDSGGKTRSSAVAGARVTAVVLPRDRFGNPTVAGSKAPFSFQFKHQPREGAAAPHPAHDTPVPYAPPGAGQQRGPPPEQAGELRFDLAPTAAGRLRLDLASAAEPAAEPHTLELDVSPGEICWPKCTVRTATQTVTAGEEIKASIHLVDAYGNAATGAHASMFTAALRDGSDAGGPVVSGSESDFEFTMRPTRAGGQAAAVTLSGQQQAVESNPFTVLPAPVHFPACQLALREGVACAGEPCAVLLTLRDRFGNLTPLAGPAGDFRLTMFNLGDDQSSERGSVKPLPLSSPPERGAAPHEVVACCEPELRGTLEVKCTMDGDSHMHQVTVAVESGRPSVRTSTVTVDPEAVRAGETVTVRIALSDAKGNRPKCTAEELTVQVGNDGAPVQPTELQETADGFSCTFVPTKAGKAVAQFKDTRSAFAMEQAVAVRCGPLDPVKSQVRLSSDRVCAGDPLTATAHLVDSYGNSLCSDPEWISKEAKLEVKNGFAQVKPEGIEVKGGALHCRFCPTSSRAKCHLAVSVPGLSKEVARSGETEVRPAPLSWEHSTVVIDDEEARVGEPLTLVVTMKDRFKNVTDGGKADQFRVRILNAGADFSEQDVRLMGKDGSSTAFSAQFVPLEPGQVQVEVEYQGGAPKKSNTIPVHA
eukprot:TRINITY_DN18819_c3_g1_i2.p1 TRINITY_DN18819_c3_g1~~TRINITY_DN18819_c3_g1_i2.p1  ORF type:complete len:3063 (+),score=787.22 TRINITY_DN18819_c3_g1_i2:2146-11334(+)